MGEILRTHVHKSGDLMITEVNFLSVPVSRAAGENYTKDLMSGATVTVVHTIENASVTEDLDQVLIVPWFEGYSDCNMVAFNNSYYWILSAVTSTKYAKSLEIVITFNATASMVSLGDRLAGRWERTPTYNGLQENIFNTEMISTGKESFNGFSVLPKVTRSDSGDSSLTTRYQMFWCQVTAKGSTAIKQFGFFFVYAPERSTYAPAMNVSLPGGGVAAYPTLRDIINRPDEVLPIESADEIIDISYSVRCPYLYTVSATPTSTENQYTLTDVTISTKEYQSLTYAYYNLLLFNYSIKDAPEETITLNPSDAVRNCGYIELKDNQLNSVYTIPGNATPMITYRTVSDLTGLYLLIRIGPDKLIMLPEGKLPWRADSFTQYQAYSMQFDRAMMESQIKAAKESMVVGLAESAVNGVFTGALVGASGGPAGLIAGAVTGIIGAGATIYNQRLSEDQTRREQRISEKRAYAQPDSYINSAYGLNYGTLCYMNRELSVNYLLPVNYTANMDASYHLQYGYNAGGTTNIYQISKGYWQGLLFKQSTLKGERLVNEFMNGQIIG